MRKPELSELRSRLAELARTSGTDEKWPGESLELCAHAGVFNWFVPESFGGLGWTGQQIVEAYLALSAGCLTTAFVITQQTAAIDRIASSGNEELKQRLLPEIGAGRIHATVGISHLTTSRQHLARPPLVATPTGSGYRLDGFTPWVTAVNRAQWIVIGAVDASGRQVLCAIERDRPGIEIGQAADLMALTGSQTGPVKLHGVEVGREQLLTDPANDPEFRDGGRTGGLPTSTLAAGLADASIAWIEQESEMRVELAESVSRLRERWQVLHDLLIEAAQGKLTEIAEIRQHANRLASDSTNAALLAARGAGFLRGHPVERWCRQAHFFQVWSCPQNVQQAQLLHFSQCD